MEKYITGKALLERWGIKKFQIFEIIKNGLQPYSQSEKKIINRSSLIVRKKESKDEILRTLKIEQGSYRTQFMFGPDMGHQPITAKLTNEALEAQADNLFKKQTIHPPIPPDDCIAEDLSLPEDEKKAALKIQDAMKYIFRLVDVQEYESKYFPQPVNKELPQIKTSRDECFPELNTEYLKKIVARWVEQYSHRGMTTDSVILYRYDPGLLKQSMSGTRYALVFNLDHEYTISLEDLKDIETATSSIILDPYLWFAMETGFFSNAETEGLPEIFRNNDFEFVYKHPKASFHKEWMLIPLFNGYEMPGGVRRNEGQVTIYSGSSSSSNPYRPPLKDNLNTIFLKNRGIPHFPVYTCWGNNPIFRESFPKSVKYFWSDMKGAKIEKLFLIRPRMKIFKT